MYVLSFPISFLVGLVLGAGSAFIPVLGTTFPFWLSCVFAGYFQWFLALPWLSNQLAKVERDDQQR
jgi:hypothetical protein